VRGRLERERSSNRAGFFIWSRRHVEPGEAAEVLNHSTGQDVILTKVGYPTQERKFRLSVIFLRRGMHMNAEKMRRNAEHCLELASQTSDETLRMRYLRAANAWKTVAQNKERLDGALMADEPADEGSAEQVA
jgi:hypothetical protein